MSTPAPALDLDAALEVLEEMRDTDAQWQRYLAAVTDADGDIDPERYEDYEKTKLDHGWDLVTLMSDWVARLTASLAAPHAL